MADGQEACQQVRSRCYRPWQMKIASVAKNIIAKYGIEPEYIQDELF